MMSRFVFPFTLFVACSSACAVGTVGGDDGDGGLGGDDTTDAGASGDARHDGASGFDGGGGFDGSASDDGGGTDAGGVDSGTDSGGNTISCVAPSPCPGGTALGTIPGDTSGSPVTASGDTSEWLELIVSENDSSPLAVPMKLHVDLTPPSGMNFDLFVHLGGSIGAIECTAVTASSTNGVGQADSIDITWGESGTFANGTDDTRTATIEVRQISGTCQTGVSWSLSAHGH